MESNSLFLCCHCIYVPVWNKDIKSNNRERVKEIHGALSASFIGKNTKFSERDFFGTQLGDYYVPWGISLESNMHVKSLKKYKS